LIRRHNFDAAPDNIELRTADGCWPTDYQHQQFQYRLPSDRYDSLGRIFL